MANKPIAVKPMLYSVILEPLKKMALEFGYNLVIHGSMNRDMDLILIPWVDTCAEPISVINAMAELLGGEIVDKKGNFMFQGAGRLSFIINLNRSGVFKSWEDAEYYLDISVTPRVIKQELSFEEFAGKEHPDPDSLIIEDDLKWKQICLLAENYAKQQLK